jgi:hypothetical protein
MSPDDFYAEWCATRDCLRRQRWIAKALGLPDGHVHNSFAVTPFAALKTPEGYRIAIGFPAMPSIWSDDWIHASADMVGEVLVYDPARNRLEDVDDTLLLPESQPAELHVYLDPRAFLLAWCRARAWWGEEYRTAPEHLKKSLREPADGCLPGALALGRLDRLPWGEIDASTVLVDGTPEQAKHISNLIWRAAQLPRVATLNAYAKAAA